MEQIIETIKRIEKSRTALRQAIADNGLATSPRLKDLSLIQKIYEIFEDKRERYKSKRPQRVYLRCHLPLFP